jgi:protocatechuate 3,4-dioxygenase beta subunit
MSGIEKRTVAEQLSPPRPARRLPVLAPRTGKTIRVLCCLPLVFYCLPTKASEPVARADSTPKITLTGKILNGKGQPVAGAKVSMYQDTGTSWPYAQRVLQVEEMTTGADGVYAFTAERDPYGHKEGYLLVEKKGLALGWVVWQMVKDQRRDVTLNEPRKLAGQVVDETGKPVAGARVSIGGAALGKGEGHFPNYQIALDLLAVKTDADGRFVFAHLPAEARCELLVRSPGRATLCTSDSWSFPDEVFAYTPGKAEARIILPPQATIQGTAVDKTSGKPVAGVALTVQTEGRVRRLPEESVLSGEDGSFSIPSLRAGRHTIQLLQRTDRVAEWAAEPVRVSVNAGETKRDIKFELVKGSIVEALVKDASNGKPLAGVVLSVRDDTWKDWLHAQTNEAGLAQIRVAPGKCEIANVGREDYYTTTRQLPQTEVSDGATKRLEYTLAPTPRLTGIVRDQAGSPLDGVQISLIPRNWDDKTTGPDGKFEFRWNPSWPSQAGAAPFLLARDRARNLVLTADINERMSNLDLTLQLAVTLTGRVLNQEGKPLPGASIQVRLLWTTLAYVLMPEKQATTAADGTFAVAAIAPKQRYGIMIEAAGHGRHYARVDTREVKDNRMDLGEFKLPAANLSVSGVVVDVNDQPVAGANVSSYGRNQPDRRNIRTDSQGRFVIHNICAGPLTVTVNALRADRQSASGFVATEGGVTNVKVVLSQKPSGEEHVVRRLQSVTNNP